MTDCNMIFKKLLFLLVYVCTIIGCATAGKQRSCPFIDMSKYPRYERRAAFVGQCVMDSMIQFDNNQDEGLVITLDLVFLKKHFRNVVYRRGVLTLQTYRSQYDIYLISLGKCIKEEFTEEGNKITLYIKSGSESKYETDNNYGPPYWMIMYEDHGTLWQWDFGNQYDEKPKEIVNWPAWGQVATFNEETLKRETDEGLSPNCK